MKKAGPAVTTTSRIASAPRGPATRGNARPPAQTQRLERQAQRAAQDFQRGQTGLAAALSSTQPAGLLDFHQSGSPLAGALRTRMEAAFGADLAAVRIHTDSAARAYTRARRGRALAAGNHILFADARFPPDLLAHELAHTLQQTGVFNAASGRWQVRSMLGSSSALFSGDEQSPLPALTPVPSDLDLEKIAALYIAAYPNNALLPEALKMARQDLDGADDDKRTRFWQEMDDSLSSVPSVGKDAKVQQRFCMVADWLKSRKLYTGAANLADKLSDYRTVYFDTGIYPALIARDLNWIGVVWGASNFLKGYPPGLLAESYATYLFGATRDIPALGPKGDFQAKVAEFLNGRGKVGEHGELAVAEPVYYAAWALQQADRFRIEQMQQQANRVAPGVASSRVTPLQRYQIAQAIDEWARGLSEGKGLEGKPAPVQRIFIELGADIRRATSLAVRYWRLVDQSAAAWRQGGSVEGVGDLRVIMTREAAKPKYQDFQVTLQRGLDKLFALDPDGDPMAAADYETAVKTLIGDLRKSAYKNFESRLLQIVISPKPAQQGGQTEQASDIGEMVALGIMLDFAGTLVQLLGEYSRKDDDAYGALYKYGDKPAADIRIRHRLKLARYGWNLASLLGWHDIEALSAAVIGARQSVAQRSQLALIGEWQEDEDVPVRRLLDDFAPTSTLREWAPLRPIDLHRFYQTAYFKRLNAELEARLSETKYDLAGRPIVRAANIAALDKLRRPKRYSFPADGLDRAVRAEDVQDLGGLILAHPKTQALIKKEQGGSDQPPMHLVPDTVDALPFIWFFPPLDDLIARFREIDSFNVLVHDQAKPDWKPDQPRDMAAVKALSARQWLAYFSTQIDTLTAQGKAETVALPIENIEEAIEHDYQSERETLIGNLRKASIRDRFERGRGHALALLDQYSPYHGLDKVTPAKGSVDKVEFSLQVPAAVDDMIRTIVDGTEPKWERPLHQVALLLQLAPTLLDKFGERPLVEVATLFVPVISSVFKTLETTSSGAIRSVLTAEELAETGWIGARRANLVDLSDKLTKKLSEQQLTYGVIGLKSAEGSQVIKSVGHGLVIKAKEDDPFRITDANTGMQLSWKLISVERNFAYYPALGPKVAEVWELDDAGEPTNVLALTEKLAVVEINGVPHTLTGGDKALMEMLAFAVTMEVIKRQLDELAELMEQFGELTMDVLEMVPGMQPLIAARMVVSILAFVASPDFEAIKKTVTEDPAKVFKELFDKIMGMIDPGMLWEILLFSDTSAFNRLHGKKIEKKPALKKGGTAVRLAKLIDRMFNFGEEVIGDFSRYQSWMRWQAERVEVFVQQRPALNTVLHFIALYFDQIVALATTIGEYLDADPAHRDAMSRGLNDWPQSVHDLVIRVADLQLPDEVLPMGDLVEALVELVISRLGPKYKVGANVVLYLLRLIGKEKEVFDYIAAQIPDALNPNTYWKKYVKEPVNQKLDEGGKAFAKGIFDFMADSLVTIDRLKDQAPRFSQFSKRIDTDFAARRAEEKEAAVNAQQPYGWHAGMQARAMAPPQGGGVPLSGTLRHGNEGWFGQDFSHVRIHRDGPAQRYTQVASAAAITAGSHIYLGRGVDPSSSMGQHVMRHELAHVTQQTGTRPLGRNWPSAAMAPRPGQGLVFDSVREAQAERAARQPPQIGAVQGRADLGAQPATLAELSQRFLTKITSTLETDTKSVLGGLSRLEKIPASVSPRLKGFWETYDEALAALTTKNDTFKSAIPHVKNHLSETGDTTTGVGKEVKAALHQAVLDSIRETGKEKDDKGDEKPVYSLDKSRLEISLSQRILGIAGIDLEIKLAEGKGQDKDKGPLKVASLELRYIHLAVIHGGSPLWKNLATKVPGEDLPIMRGVLYDEGIALGVWQSNVYDLTSRIRDKAANIRKLGKTSVTSTQLPTVADYTKTDPAGTTDNIGLRLGVYDDRGGSQSGPDRESHHTSQFLLVEFFANAATEKAFPWFAANPDFYPGVNGSKSGVETIGEATSAIKVGKQVERRGGIMPCILLSTVAHRLPGLHMTPDIDDQKDGVHVQAGVVRRRFESALGKFKPLTSDNPDDAALVARQSNRAERKDAIYNAVLETYHAVWEGRMKNGLKNALLGPERAYYNALAEQKYGGHSGERLTPSLAMEVWAKAVQHNNKLMSEQGWK